MGKPLLYRGFRLRRRPAVHPSRPSPAHPAAQQRRQMHADLLRHPDAGLHLPLLRVGAGPGPGHGAVAMPVRGRCRLPPPGLGLPPLAHSLPVRPPGMALAHRHHVPHAAFLQTDVQRKLRYYITFFPFHPGFSERRRNRTHSLLRPARNKTIPALQEVRTMLKYPAATNRHRIPGT